MSQLRGSRVLLIVGELLTALLFASLGVHARSAGRSGAAPLILAGLAILMVVFHLAVEPRVGSDRRATRELLMRADPQAIKERALAALRSLAPDSSISEVDESTFTMRVPRLPGGGSGRARSPGEEVTLSLHVQADGSTNVHVSSRHTRKMLRDFGSNEANVRRIADSLRSVDGQ